MVLKSFYHKINSLMDPTQFFLEKGYWRVFKGQNEVHNRKPICAALLFRICQKLNIICTNNYEERLFKAAYTLTYHGLFRVSEIISTSLAYSNQALQYNDISF